MAVDESRNDDKGVAFSERVKAGKRTYFFDIKTTWSNDYYITITESKRKSDKEGEGVVYEKHKIFLYKENFDKFKKALDSTVDHVKKELMPDVDFAQFD